MSAMRKDEIQDALQRVKGLTPTRQKVAEKLIDLLGADGKASVDTVLAALYENIEPSKANRELSSVVSDFRML